MRRQQSAYAFGIAAVFFWSTVATAFKLTLRHADHLQLLFYSNLFSLVILMGILIVQGKCRPAVSCSREEYGRSVLLGVLNPFAYYLILFKAYALLPAQEAQPLNYTWALTLPVLSIPLLKQRLSVFDAVALVVGYAGVVVISTRGDVTSFRLSDPLGVGLALGSAFIWALFWIFNTRDRRDPVVCLFLNFLFALPLSFLACIAFSSVPIPPRALAGVAYVGAFEMSITFVLWLTAMRYSTNTATLSTLIFIAPFLSLYLIHVFVGERIEPSTIGGLVLIVVALLIQKAGARRMTNVGRTE